jgi:exo-1,4-beta-D-glucosaminidase
MFTTRAPFTLLSLALLLAPVTASAQQILPLAESWHLQTAAKVNTGGETLSTARAKTDGWYETTVPNTVLAALTQAGAISDPYYGDNLTRIDGYREGRWMVMPPDSPFREPWWYRKSFTLPQNFAGKHVVLHFDGINYEANIWLNGKKVADRKDVKGMFRRFHFDVTDICHTGQENYLAVEIFAPARGPDKRYRTKQIEATTGWDDHNPQPPDANMGIWEDVYLQATGPVVVRHPFVQPTLDVPTLARAELRVETQLINLSDMGIETDLKGTIEGITFSQSVSLRPGESKWVVFNAADYPQLVLREPRVWWPNPLGPQNRYECALVASVNEKVSDAKFFNFGVSRITSYINDEGWRTYVANGKEILIRGGAWMTADMMMRYDPRQSEALVRYAHEANLNMLRSEGFSIRETNAFYDLCDRYGIMVTQQLFGRSIPDEDLAIACVEDTILRIRNHPSLVHFLGHDETFPTERLDKAYRDFIAERIPNRTYQPHSGAFDIENRFQTGGTRTGTRELWTFAHPLKYYIGREDGAWGFAQSGGIGGIVAPLDSIKRMMPEANLWPPTNDVWSLHTVIQGSDFFKTVREQIDARYGAPDGIEAFVRKAEAMNYACARAMFEAYAREKYDATGITTWKYNVAWPAAMTWAYVDWYGTTTAAYYGAKKACEVLHAQYSYDDDSIWVVNTLRQTFKELTVHARIYDDGMTLRREQVAAVDVGPDGKSRAFFLEKLNDLSTTYFLKLTLANPDGDTLSDNFYWLSTVPEIPGERQDDWSLFMLNPESVPDYTALNNLPPASVSTSKEIVTADSETIMRVTLHNDSDTLAFGLRLALHVGAEGSEVRPTYWSDNYIALLPGETRTLTGTVVNAHLDGQEPELEISGWNLADAP